MKGSNYRVIRGHPYTRREFIKGMIGNTDNMRNKRILQEILEENVQVMLY